MPMVKNYSTTMKTEERIRDLTDKLETTRSAVIRQAIMAMHYANFGGAVQQSAEARGDGR